MKTKINFNSYLKKNCFRITLILSIFFIVNCVLYNPFINNTSYPNSNGIIKTPVTTSTPIATITATITPTATLTVTPTPTPLYNAYIAFYSFTNNNANDLSGHNNHLSIILPEWVTPAPDRASTANHAFDLINDTTPYGYLYNDNPPDLNISTELTISVWINTDDASINQKIINRTNSTFSRGYILGIASNHVYYEIYDSTGVLYQITIGSIISNTWYHLALTWKTGGKMRAYVNSNLTEEIDASSNPIGDPSGSGSFRIGVSAWNTTNFAYNGLIDDIRIYDKELSGTDVQYLYALPPD